MEVVIAVVASNEEFKILDVDVVTNNWTIVWMGVKVVIVIIGTVEVVTTDEAKVVALLVSVVNVKVSVTGNTKVSVASVNTVVFCKVLVEVTVNSLISVDIKLFVTVLVPIISVFVA